MHSRRLTRRELLRTSAATLLAAGVWPGSLWAADSTDEFRFLAVNDLHSRDNKCAPWFEKVVGQMKAEADKIDFCLIEGDLADNGKPEQFARVRDIFQTLNMPVHVVIGNHDYLKQDDRKPYEDLFPRQINYFFEHRGWQFLGLDSSEGQHYQNTVVSPDTLNWVENTLSKLDRKRPTVLFTHFPLGPEVKNRPKNADDLLNRFKDCNLRAVLSGHHHAFTERRLNEAVLTTNRCCAISVGNHDGTKEKGYFVCHAREGKLARRFVEVKPAT